MLVNNVFKRLLSQVCRKSGLCGEEFNGIMEVH